MNAPRDQATTGLKVGDLLDAFEKMSSEERRHHVERANAFFSENGIDTLAKFDEWNRK